MSCMLEQGLVRGMRAPHDECDDEDDCEDLREEDDDDDSSNDTLRAWDRIAALVTASWP